MRYGENTDRWQNKKLSKLLGVFADYQYLKL